MIYYLFIYLFLMLAVSVFLSFREILNKCKSVYWLDCSQKTLRAQRGWFYEQHVITIRASVTVLLCSRSCFLRDKLHPASNSSDSQVCLCVNIHTYLTLIERYVGAITPENGGNSPMSWDLKPQQCAGRDIFVSGREFTMKKGQKRLTFVIL